MVMLIADDEAIIREGLLSIAWDTLGISTVLSASNGLQVMQILAAQHVDILLTDIRMPGSDGIELASFIQQYHLNTAVVFLTGYSEFEYAHSAIQLGVENYILKPIQKQQLMQVIQSIIEKINHEKEHRQSDPMYNVDTLSQCFPNARHDVCEMLGFIDRHYAEDISLQRFADQFYISMAYASRIFRKETGYCYSNVLCAIRLYRAALLLSIDSVKVQEACVASGFKNARYFATMFKRAMHTTPSQFRSIPHQVSLSDILHAVSDKPVEIEG